MRHIESENAKIQSYIRSIEVENADLKDQIMDARFENAELRAEVKRLESFISTVRNLDPSIEEIEGWDDKWY